MARGPSLRAIARLRSQAQSEDGRIQQEAELALAFIDVVQRCKAHPTEELPHLVVRAIRGKRSAMNFVELTAETAKDETARNLARAALMYIKKWEQWKGHH